MKYFRIGSFFYKNSFIENKEGMHRSDLVEWYLNLVADQIESEEELVVKKELIEKVIDRLTYHVSVYCLLPCKCA